MLLKTVPSARTIAILLYILQPVFIFAQHVGVGGGAAPVGAAWGAVSSGASDGVLSVSGVLGRVVISVDRLA
jgi:hypothetical protein